MSLKELVLYFLGIAIAAALTGGVVLGLIMTSLAMAGSVGNVEAIVTFTTLFGLIGGALAGILQLQ